MHFKILQFIGSDNAKHRAQHTGSARATPRQGPAGRRLLKRRLLINFPKRNKQTTVQSLNARLSQPWSWFSRVFVVACSLWCFHVPRCVVVIGVVWCFGMCFLPVHGVVAVLCGVVRLCEPCMCVRDTQRHVLLPCVGSRHVVPLVLSHARRVLHSVMPFTSVGSAGRAIPIGMLAMDMGLRGCTGSQCVTLYTWRFHSLNVGGTPVHALSCVVVWCLFALCLLAGVVAWPCTRPLVVFRGVLVFLWCCVVTACC